MVCQVVRELSRRAVLSMYLYYRERKNMTVNAQRVRATEGIEGRDAVGLYLDEISRTPLLTAEAEVQLAKAIEAGVYASKILDGTIMPGEPKDDTQPATRAELEEIARRGREAMQHFVSANLRLVVSVARKYGRANMPLLDLIQEGNTGLIRAVEKFDYAKGFKFSTYATWWIRQSISRGIAQQGRIVRLPVHVAEQVNQMATARRTLELRLGREPELDEIAAELELDTDRVVELIRLSHDHISLDAPVDSEGETAFGDLMTLETVLGPDDVVVNAEERARLESMLNMLDARSADVVRRRYGLLDGRQTKLADIAVVWGITAERVRQIERAAIATLRNSGQLAA